MKKLICALMLLATVAQAQISTINLSSLVTNTALSSGSQWLTAYGQFTNVLFSTVKSNNIIVGDSLYNAFTKVNNGFAWLSSSVRTNGATNNSTPIWTTNGLYWGAASTGGGGSSGGIVTNNGTGWGTTLLNGKSITTTNLTVTADTYLNNSALHFYTPSILTNNPVMTASNSPSGLVTSSTQQTGYEAWRAFGASGNWSSTASLNPWVQYQFATPFTATNLIGYNFTSGGGGPSCTVSLQASSDGFSWITVTSFVTNSLYGVALNLSFSPVTATYFRLQYANGYSALSQCQGVIISGNSVDVNIADSTVKTLEILAPAVAVNTNTANGYTLEVNGTIDGTVAVSGGLGNFFNVQTSDILNAGNNDAASYTLNGFPINFASITNIGILSLWVTNCVGQSSNYNGVYLPKTATVWTNANGYAITQPGAYTNFGIYNGYAGGAIARYCFMVTNYSGNWTNDFSYGTIHTPSDWPFWSKYKNIFGTWTWEIYRGHQLSNCPLVSVYAYTNSGAAVTNTITVMNFSNSVLNSKEYQTYITNYAHWTGSNFLARVAGLSRFSITGGDDAGNPPQAIPISLLGSFTGTNAFFTVTNGYWTSNTISLWAISGLTNAVSGLPMVNPGFCALYSLDHWELKGRNNQFDGQTWTVNGYPIANQNDVQNAFNSAFNGNWSFYTDTNTVYHTIYSRLGQTIVDLASATSFVPGASAGLDGTGTNFVMGILQTNLVAGYFVETITNLSVPNWLLFTNYTLSTNTGVVSFTIPINITEPMRAFRARGTSTNTAIFNMPIESNGGEYYPSNTWNLATITNRMKNFSFWTGNSNGAAYVGVYLSNGVARIKQLAP